MATIYDGGMVATSGARAGAGHAWLQLILAVWLLVSPWVLGFAAVTMASADPNSPGATGGTAAWNACIIGAVAALLALSRVLRLRMWQDQAILVLGAWVFAAPWVLGFAHWWPVAAWDHWITGLFLFLVSAWAIPSAPKPE